MPWRESWETVGPPGFSGDSDREIDLLHMLQSLKLGPSQRCKPIWGFHKLLQMILSKVIWSVEFEAASGVAAIQFNLNLEYCKW